MKCSGKDILKFAGSFSKKDLAQMKTAIQSGCGNIEKDFDIRLYDKAKISKGASIPIEDAFKFLDAKRNKNNCC